MNHKIIVTEDNSNSIFVENLNETYHSSKGAITESNHIYINNGLAKCNQSEINIFEMGFGTGLNAMLSFEYSLKHSVKIMYETCEKYPLDFDTVQKLNFDKLFHFSNSAKFLKKIHHVKSHVQVNESHFQFLKYHEDFINLLLKPNHFDICFYDAFAPKIQPKLWGKESMTKIYESLKSGGFLVTYCAQGEFKRTLTQVGFSIQSLPGPPGKREITRAWKMD